MDNSFIAPVVNPRQSGPNKFLVIGGIIVVLLIVLAGFLMIRSSSGGPTDDIARANARLATLDLMVESGQENAESADLRKIVSEASILLIGDVSRFSQDAAAAGAKASDRIVAEENEAELLERMTTAAVNGQFDIVFVPALIEKYEDTTEIMERIYRSSNNEEIRDTTATVIAHNEAMLSQLRSLNL